jgi:hypothetical protein
MRECGIAHWLECRELPETVPDSVAQDRFVAMRPNLPEFQPGFLWPPELLAPLELAMAVLASNTEIVTLGGKPGNETQADCRTTRI